MKKTLILNGSPRKTGDTAFLLSELKSRINHEIIENWNRYGCRRGAANCGCTCC